jgi:hypothetical protein
MKETKTCKICGTIFNTYQGSDYCSRACYYKSKVGKKWGNSFNEKRGKYSEKQIKAMVKGKILGQIERNLYRLLPDYEQKIRSIISENYISSYSFIAMQVTKDKKDRVATKVVKNLIEQKYFLSEKVKSTIKYPNKIQEMTLSQYKEFTSILQYKNYGELKYFLAKNEIVLRASVLYEYITLSKITLHDKDLYFIENHNKVLKSPQVYRCGTLPERIVYKALEHLGYSFKAQFPILAEDTRYYYDFIVENKLLIEVNGDYWHGYKDFYPNPNEMQLERQQKDLIKKQLADERGYKYLCLWEHDLVPKKGVLTLESVNIYIENQIKAILGEIGE